MNDPPTRNKPFAAAVERIAAGRSNRILADLTGVNPTSIGDMRWGRVPGYRLLERFADGLGVSDADRRELFATAGYALPPAEADESPPYDAGHYLIELLRRLAATYGPEWVVMPRSQPPAPDAAREEMERQARELEEEIRRERAEHDLPNPPPVLLPDDGENVTKSSGSLGGECSPPGEISRYESVRSADFALSR